MFNNEEISKLAPDDASLKAAKGLLNFTKWGSLGQDEIALWGECQGSGSNPYQVRVDKSSPAFKCSCPSRKFPCKHGLALLFLLNQDASKFSQKTQPEWVSAWIQSRKNKEKPEPKPIAPEEKEKKESKRLTLMQTGLEEAQQWMQDRLKQGLMHLPSQPEIWQEISSSMINHKLPGMANLFNAMGKTVLTQENWTEGLSSQLGKTYFLSTLLENISFYPPAIAADIKQAIGVNLHKDEVLAQGNIAKDTWLILGQNLEEENDLWARRIWIRGETTNHWGLILEYSYKTPNFEQHYKTGSLYRGEVAFYPSNAPLRCIFTHAERAEGKSVIPLSSLPQTLNKISTLIAKNPWQPTLPFFISHAIPYMDENQCYAKIEDSVFKMSISEQHFWEIMSLSGGTPIALFAEWNGRTLSPLTSWKDDFVWIKEVK